MRTVSSDTVDRDEDPRRSSRPADATSIVSLLQDSASPETPAELQRSHQRLVIVRHQERCRLLRDLHDGLGPALAAVVLQLGVAKSLLADPSAAGALLVRLGDQVQEAIAEMRRLVYEMRPPALDELGLAGALREQAARFSRPDLLIPSPGNLAVTVEAPRVLPALPAAVEAAAYRIATEALANVAQHAHASTCHVRLALNAGLEIEVRDDGRGLPAPSRAGAGVASMRERAAELGGTWTIGPASGCGTRVYARLPLPQEA